MKWRTVALTDICRPRQWKTIPTSVLTETGYPVFGANGIIGFYPEYNHEKPTVVITCRGATCGTVGITLPKSYITGNAMALDELDEDQVDQKFLYYQLSRRGFRDVISGTAQPQITGQGLAIVKIDLPPLPEQKRIAAILDKADAIRRKREKAIELTDSFLRSVFLEMFGDPSILPQVSVQEIAEVKGGKRLPKGAEYEDKPTAHPYIRVVDFKNKSVDTSDLRFISEDIHKKISRYTISSQDVYISIAGTIGVVGTIPVELSGANLTENAAKLVIKNKSITPAYLCWALASPLGQAQIRAKTMATSQPKLALFRIEEIVIPLPPLSRQHQFIKIVEQAESLVRRMNKGLIQSLSLSKSLTSSLFGNKGLVEPSKVRPMSESEEAYAL